MEFIILIIAIILGLTIIKKSSHEKKVINGVDYGKYLASEHWINTKTIAKKRAGYKCEKCGYTRSLSVHHKNFNNLWHENPQDLIVLCRKCLEKNYPKKN